MARDKTFNALDDVFADDYESDELVVEEVETDVKEDKKSTDLDIPTPSVKTQSRKAKTEEPFKISFDKKEPEAVTRTFRINTDISRTLTSIVSDSNGEKKEGSKGFLSRLVNNAVIKELVELGALDESYLNEIIPYDE